MKDVERSGCSATMTMKNPGAAQNLPASLSLLQSIPFFVSDSAIRNMHVYFASSDGMNVVNPRLSHLRPPLRLSPIGVSSSRKVAKVIHASSFVRVPLYIL